MDSQQSTRDPLQLTHTHRHTHQPHPVLEPDLRSSPYCHHGWLASCVSQYILDFIRNQQGHVTADHMIVLLRLFRSHVTSCEGFYSSLLIGIRLIFRHNLLLAKCSFIKVENHVGVLQVPWVPRVLQVPAKVHWVFLICSSFTLLTFQSFHRHISKDKLSEMVFQVIRTVFHTSVAPLSFCLYIQTADPPSFYSWFLFVSSRVSH